MRRYINLAALLSTVILLWSCTNEEEIKTTGKNEIPSINIEMGDMTVSGEVTTRAIPGYSVNTNADPTYLAKTTGWELDITLYDKQQGNAQYGQSICDYTGGTWVPRNQLHFPNYLRQEYTATLYPVGWTPGTTIALDQSTTPTLVAQDIQVQHHDASATADRGIVFPAHIPTISMEHMYTMLDIVLKDVVEANIQPGTVKIIDGTNTYTPYQIPGKMEYLVILPVGTQNPKVTLTTTGGIHYEEEILIDAVHTDGTHRNTCYCATLVGVELLLSTVTVADWVYGEALSGQYTTIASNPTFNGPANTQITLIYRSGNEQTIYFNRWGEITVRPAGRTIIALRKEDGTTITLPNPIILDQMTIDLNPYLS